MTPESEKSKITSSNHSYVRTPSPEPEVENIIDNDIALNKLEKRKKRKLDSSRCQKYKTKD